MTREESAIEREVGNKKSRDNSDKREQERETCETLTNGREFHIQFWDLSSRFTVTCRTLALKYKSADLA